MSREGKVTVVGSGFLTARRPLQRLAGVRHLRRGRDHRTSSRGKPEGHRSGHQPEPVHRGLRDPRRRRDPPDSTVSGYERTGPTPTFVVITAGPGPAKPGMSRMDLIETKRQDRAAGRGRERRGSSRRTRVIVVVSNPARRDDGAHLQREQASPKARVVGQAGHARPPARFKQKVRRPGSASRSSSVGAITPGQPRRHRWSPYPSVCHCRRQAVCPRCSTRRPLPSWSRQTREGGAEIRGAAQDRLRPTTAPSAAAARMVKAIQRGCPRDHAGLRLGRRPVRHLGRLPRGCLLGSAAGGRHRGGRDGAVRTAS